MVPFDQFKFPPSLSVLDVICSPLIQLISILESTSMHSDSSQPIRVDLSLKSSPTFVSHWNVPQKPMPLCLLLSPLGECEELKKFLDQKVLTIIPLDIAVEDLWPMND